MYRRDAAIGTALALLAVMALGPAALAQGPKTAPAKPAVHHAAKPWTPPRTAWGDPDLTGTWPLDSVARTPFQRPEHYGNQLFLTDDEYNQALKNAADLHKRFATEERVGKLSVGHWTEYGEPSRQTSLITDPANGRLPPMTAEGKRLAAGMKSSWSQKVFDDLSDFNSLDKCITRGLPASMLPFPYNNGVRIFQSPGYVVIQLEIVHEYRIIPLDDHAPLPGQMSQWLGSSRGHFEGNTLVIETTNFNGESPMVIVGPTNQPAPTSRQLHITERLTPIGPDTLQYEARVEDPDVMTAPWTMSFPWTRNDKYMLYEYACHEGNIQLAGYIRGTSPRFAEYRKEHGGTVDATAPSPH
jgi:hypothetical protein